MARAMPAEPAAVTVSEVDANRPYVDWSAVIAGAVLSTAIALILFAFGSALGLSFASPYREVTERSMWIFAIAAALWLLWVQVSSFIAGGYLAGRLRRRHHDATPQEVEVRDGAHGLVVWALGTLISALIAAVIGTGLVNVAGGIAGTAAQTAATAASGNTRGQGPEADAMSYLVDTLFRPSMTTPGGAAEGTAPPSAVPSAPGTATTLPQPGSAGMVGGMSGSMGPQVMGSAEQSRESRQEVSRILTASSVRGGDVSADDKAYIARVVAERSGLSRAEAERRVNDTLTKAKEDAKAVADKARKATLLATFVTVASLLIGAAAAWWAASMGGRDRDAGTAFSFFGRWGY